MIRLYRLKFASCLITLLSLCLMANSSEIVVNGNVDDGFPIVNGGISATVYVDSSEVEVVKIAANLFATDIKMVTQQTPEITQYKDSLNEYAIIIGSIENSSLIKQLQDSGKINVDTIRHKWESYLYETIDNPFPGIKKALVIAGSDRRGTAYGVFEISKAIGVSPWYWWADVTPQQKDSLVLSSVSYVSKEPTVKYRGIFINDEDWGLQEWAEKTFDPVRDIGPTTYAKVFELLLRLKANYIWPAMHPCTKPFNYYAQNKVVADKYAILMGSSHHEPLLYNTAEWPFDKGLWNPFTNMETIMGELEKRVKSNGQYENVYTVGIRGTGDGSVSGGSSLNDKTAKLEEVIDRQRGLLTQYVDSTITNVPQVFWPYKEVMDQYNNNMNLPDDITLGWVDDNHGYIRQVSNPTEQKRSGGSGVYYHVSYWGSPADYLWIATTQPALIATEMKKAAEYGADRIWIFNVGDIKPAEILMNYSLDLAWDYNKWDASNVREYLMQWFTEVFGDAYAEDLTNCYFRYYQLSHRSKPEHINRASFPASEIENRIAAFDSIADIVETMKSEIPADLSDAFFELVYYPIQGAKLMNQKFLYAHKSFVSALEKDQEALTFSQKAKAAHSKIYTLTNQYNNGIKNGKWNRIISSDIRMQSVYDMPAVATQTDIDKNHVTFPDINLAEGTYVLPMKYENGVVYGNKSGVQTTTSGGKAQYTFELSQSINADIFFYMKTPTDKEDSWHININGTQFIQNNYVTGGAFEWVKVKNMTLKSGTNTITINQREGNAQIGDIKIAEPGMLKYAKNYIKNPSQVIPVYQFDTKHNAAGFEWNVIEGLSTSEKAITNLPYNTASVSNVTNAPYIEKEINVTSEGFILEVRCLPTRRLYKGRDLRIALAFDDNSPQVYSINHPYPTVAWEKNVLQGYTSISKHYTSTNSKVKVRLYALDPGVVFDQVIVYNDDTKVEKEDSIVNATNEIIIEENQQTEYIYPNPFTDVITIKNYNAMIESAELIDITGRVVIKKIVKGSDNAAGYTLSTSSVKDGDYFLRVNKASGYSTTYKMIKY